MTIRPRLKKIQHQVIVITGASSGIGLATARLAAERGARVVLAARNEGALSEAVDGITKAGGRATFAVADVADAQAVQRVADTAIREFGGFDTWVNNASSSIYGRLTDIEMEDKRRLFDVNFWGVVHGCRVAVPHLRARGGTIITTGSILSDRAIPLLGIYSAAKHAVKAYIDTLRMELEEEGAPISVTLVKPSSIDTPFFDHARTYMHSAPAPVPPVYAPELVAQTILECAQRPVRDIIVGGGGMMLAAMGTYAPRLTDKYMERTAFEQQQDVRPVRADRADNLFEPARDGEIRGRYDGRVLRSSAYTTAALNPGPTLAVLGAGVAALAAIRFLRASRQSNDRRGEPVESADVANGGVPDTAEGALYTPGTRN